jgi:hypothetical protein
MIDRSVEFAIFQQIDVRISLLSDVVGYAIRAHKHWNDLPQPEHVTPFKLRA